MASKNLLQIDMEFLENYPAQNTRINYQKDIEKFFKFLNQEVPAIKKLSSIKRIHVVKYRNWLSQFGGRNGEPCAPKSVGRMLASLSSYFHALVEKGTCSSNPVISVKRPRQEVLHATYALDVEQVRELLKASLDKKRPCSYLHHALLTTFFTTGLRLSEIIKLRFCDYLQINGIPILKYRGKGGKIDQKVVHDTCQKSLDQYIEWMKEQKRTHKAKDPLFQPTKNPSNPKKLNKPLNPKTVNEILNYYAKKIGIDRPISPHCARATFISELLNNGVDIYSVAREVNHSSVKTTQEYDKRRKKLSDSPVRKLPY